MLKKIILDELQPNQRSLYLAIQRGCSTTIEYQLAQGTNLDGYDLSDIINCYISRDITPLIDAIIFNNVETVKFLLSNGADSNLKDKIKGFAPLHFAVYNKNQEIAELLLKYNANINEKHYGNNVLHILLVMPEAKAPKTLSLLKFLIANGVDVNAISKDDRTPLDVMKSMGIDIDIENKIDDTNLMPNLSESKLNEDMKMLGVDKPEE